MPQVAWLQMSMNGTQRSVYFILCGLFWLIFHNSFDGFLCRMEAGIHIVVATSCRQTESWSATIYVGLWSEGWRGKPAHRVKCSHYYCWVQTIFIYSAVCVLCKLFCSFKLLVYSYMYTMFSCYFYALYIDSVQSSPAYCGLFYSPVDFTDASDLSTLMQINRRTHTVGWSQAHVNWERCGGKGIRHKIMGWDVGFYRSQLCGCCKPASRLFHLLTSKF